MNLNQKDRQTKGGQMKKTSTRSYSLDKRTEDEIEQLMKSDECLDMSASEVVREAIHFAYENRNELRNSRVGFYGHVARYLNSDRAGMATLKSLSIFVAVSVALVLVLGIAVGFFIWG